MTATRPQHQFGWLPNGKTRPILTLHNIAHVSLGSTDLVSVEIAMDANSMVSIDFEGPQRIPPTQVPSGGSTTVETTFTK
jgi:hypothetical protein